MKTPTYTSIPMVQFVGTWLMACAMAVQATIYAKLTIYILLFMYIVHFSYLVACTTMAQSLVISQLVHFCTRCGTIKRFDLLWFELNMNNYKKGCIFQYTAIYVPVLILITISTFLKILNSNESFIFISQTQHLTSPFWLPIESHAEHAGNPVTAMLWIKNGLNNVYKCKTLNGLHTH